ncbi:mucin-associated surface protein (MASP) [Trypanosoma cruzi]|nr:mucin-associated surface protein (MASP) [Trypanosoma cruzi]
MVVFCFTCFCCRAVCSALCPASVTLNASRTHSYVCALEPWVCFSFLFNFCFLIIVFYCFLNFWFAVRCASSAIVLIPSVSWCVRCCCFAAICCCAWFSGCVYLFASLSVDGELVCAEGCTQVTGVMAMMTGRVLLVCALCVLWCGDEGVGSPAGGAGGLLGNGGKGAVETTDNSTSAPDGSDLTKGLPKVNQSTETSTGKSLEVDEVNAEQQDVAPEVEDEDGSPSDHLEESLKDDPDQGKTKPEIQNKGQEGRQTPQSQVTVPQ